MSDLERYLLQNPPHVVMGKGDGIERYIICNAINPLPSS
jgi:hypothetical protein